LQKLVKFRDDNQHKIKLTFLGPEGWNFPKLLSKAQLEEPSNIMKLSILIDRLEGIEDSFKLLAVLTNEDTLQQKREDLTANLPKSAWTRGH